MNELIENFDPNAPADNLSGIYGLPFGAANSNIILLPVPWEATVSYGKGTSKGPEAIYQASFQVDLYDPISPDAWKAGIYMDDIIYQWYDEIESPEKINIKSEALNAWVEARSAHFVEQNKLVGVIGGEHSSPYGLIKLLSSKHNNLSILQIDAHADLRKAYEGYNHSHASIMYNAIQLEGVKKLTQVGIRDYCHEEISLIEQNPKINTFFDQQIKQQQFAGDSWKSICDHIVSTLTDEVYISFDIDGLVPYLCPNTGTPVPGGFELEEAMFLINRVISSGKKIVGFDLCEVTPGDDEWDGNVGARVLYRLCNLIAKSNDLI